jgi:hypothetical protein
MDNLCEFLPGTVGIYGPKANHLLQFARLSDGGVRLAEATVPRQRQ